MGKRKIIALMHLSISIRCSLFMPFSKPFEGSCVVDCISFDLLKRFLQMLSFILCSSSFPAKFYKTAPMELSLAHGVQLCSQYRSIMKKWFIAEKMRTYSDPFFLRAIFKLIIHFMSCFFSIELAEKTSIQYFIRMSN